jgi:hypothetical protein
MNRSRTLTIAIATVAALVIFGAGVSVGANKYGTPRSIVHVVTVMWKTDATADQKTAAIEGVKNMAAEIPGIKNVWIKTAKVQGVGHEKDNEGRRYDAAFAMEFEDKAAFDKYADHPAHQAWEKIYIPVRAESTTHDVTN